MSQVHTYQCNRCKKLSTNVISENWIQITTTGNTTISEGVVTKLRLKPTESLHFCSPECYLNYLIFNITNGEEVEKYSDAIREILDTNKPVDVNGITVARIDEFTISLEGTVPNEVWQNNVMELGLDPTDYLVVNDGDKVNMTKIVNIYKEHYNTYHNNV